MGLQRGHESTYAPSRTRRLAEWFDVRGRGLGGWAFVVQRVTGIGLVVYLALHLSLLSLLAGGEASWHDFLTLARSPLFRVLDVILFAGLLLHGLNGIRVTLVAMGVAVERHKVLFVGATGLSVAVLAYAAVRIFTM